MIVPIQKDEELVRDFHTADNVTGALHLWWMGHSGFLVKWNGFGILIDPCLSDSLIRKYEGTDEPKKLLLERVCDPLLLSGIEVVVVSNMDPDHFDPETILALRSANPHLKVVLPAGNLDEARKVLGPAAPLLVPVNAGAYVDVSPFQLHAIRAANPTVEEDENGDSLNLGYVLLFGQFSIYHSGDTLWHNSLIREVRRWPINLAFLPINGDNGKKGRGDNLNGFEAAALAKAISTSLTIPCHYDMFDPGNVSTEEFETCCDRLNLRHRVLDPGQRLTMGPVFDPAAGKAPASEAQRNTWNLGY